MFIPVECYWDIVVNAAVQDECVRTSRRQNTGLVGIESLESSVIDFEFRPEALRFIRTGKLEQLIVADTDRRRRLRRLLACLDFKHQ